MDLKEIRVTVRTEFGYFNVEPKSSCEHCSELSDSIRGREFLNQMSGSEFLLKDCAPWS
jgi:hypothetical protein